MTILSGDIKLVASQVMLDTPEGGGAPSGTVINDGTSNTIFPDISELDRAGGRVNLRKTFASVQTTNVDQYFGANVIVSDPPQDPRVSVTLFSTEEVFDRRSDAQGRMESYLAQGPVYSGYLFGDHIAGMAVVTILQREEVPLPVVGDTLVLRAYQGTASEVEQFVRVSDVSSSLRTFTDVNGDFKRLQVVLELTDSLREDYPGFDAIRQDASINYINKTRVYSTIVADAARYFGVVPLENAVVLGDLTAKATGIFSQLVPSTRIEVPISDARMNQQLNTLVPAGDSLSITPTLAFTTSQALYVGGQILPGSLTLVRAGITLIDKGGLLMDGATQVGTVDYDNGVLTLLTNVFGTSAGSHAVTYTPAGSPIVVSESLGLEVTQQGQRLSWVATLPSIPAKRTLTLSYRSFGRWYVLSDDGAGVLRGADSAFGAGTINYTTGTMAATLGALPDVDSRIVLSWAPAVYSRPLSQVSSQVPTTLPAAFSKTVTVPGGIRPTSLVITWNDGTARTATDNNGELAGDATGTVDYGTGEIVFRPNLLPAKNTTINVAVDDVVKVAETITGFTDAGSTWTYVLTNNSQSRSVKAKVKAQYPMRKFPGIDETVTFDLDVFEDGAGALVVGNITGNLQVGTIARSDSPSQTTLTFNKTTAGYKVTQPIYQNTTPLGASGDPSSYIKLIGYETRIVTLTIINVVDAATVTRSTTVGSGANYNFPLDALFLAAYSPRGWSVSLGGVRHVSYFDGSWNVESNPSATTGRGTNVGVFGAVGGKYGAVLTTWTAGISPNVTQERGTTDPSVSGDTSMLVDSALIRSAISPLLNSSFSVAGTRRTGETFNASANNAGLIKTGGDPANATSFGTFGVFGQVDYEMGIADLRFGQAAGSSMHAAPGVIDISELGIPGVTHILAVGVQSDTLRYNAVGYSYLPLDADILGLDPVRLPADGRVPIFRSGTFAVLGHTGTVGPANVSNGQTLNCGRIRLSRVRVIGNNGAIINTGYTADLDAGTVTFTDVTGYSQPVTVEHRIEDMMLVSQALINGQLSFTREVSHDYPVPGSYVSSALVIGDMNARVSLIFDQSTWNNVFSDTISGSAATGTYNDILNPIEVTNKGALTERWAVQFINSTSFNVIGEHVGVIATGNTGSDCAPLNPATGVPYFTIRSAGWGLGWATGNVLRFNTVGAFYPVWVARTILQGPESVPNDTFTLLIRGDVDNPI